MSMNDGARVSTKCRTKKRYFSQGTTSGGAIIGWGHDENMVYTIDEIANLYPDATAVKLVTGTGEPKRDSKGEHLEDRSSDIISLVDIVSTRQGVHLQQGIALKHVSDVLEYLYEFGINLNVREMFLAADLMHYTVVHDRYDTAHILMSVRGSDIHNNDKSDAVISKELIYKRMVGSVHELDSTDEDILLVIMRNCLMFLCVLHKQGIIHMDIKPENILYDIESGNVRCILADYGFLTPMSHVFSRLKKEGSFFQGTVGYISPLLMSDDDENRVYDKFSRVYLESEKKKIDMLKSVRRGGSGYDPYSVPWLKDNKKRRGSMPISSSEQYWDEYFMVQKRRMTKASDLSKTDLQSLALTMLTMKDKFRHRWEMQFPSKNKTSHDADIFTKRMCCVDDMIARLLLHRNGDFFTAGQALQYLVVHYRNQVKLSNDGAAKRDIIKALEVSGMVPDHVPKKIDIQ